MLNVFNLPQEILDAVTVDDDPEAGPVDLDGLLKTIAESQGIAPEGPVPATAEVTDFALRLAKAGRYLQGEIDYLKETIDDLTRRRELRKARLEGLRRFLAWYMSAWNIKAKDPTISVWTAKSPPSCEVQNVDAVPAVYVTKEITVLADDVPEGYEDKVTATHVHRDAILAAFKETGEQPAGVLIFTGRNHVVWR